MDVVVAVLLLLLPADRVIDTPGLQS